VRYHGVPATGLRIGKNKYGERTFFSVNWPDLAHQWLPIIDHPSDKASSEFIVTAPARYQVVANGLLQEEIDLGDGQRLTHWKESVPVASWMNVIGVAQFASHHAGTVKGIPLQTWVYHQDFDAGIITFEEPARQAIEFYSDFIGPYPYEKLADVQAAGRGGGTEYATAIFYGENLVTTRPATAVVAHEVAHQWFGDSVTERDWDDVWLSEGFATYLTLLFTEHYQGRDAFVAGLKRSRDTVFATERRTPGVTVVHNNLSDMRRVLTPAAIFYQKGGWVLHMLRGVIGPTKFQAGIREYYKRYRDANASTDDFRRIMEDSSGLDLAWFFDQWLKRSGHPMLQGTWRYDATAKRIEIELTQTQQGEVFRLPMEVAIQGAGAAAPVTEKIEMTQRQQRFVIAAEREPASVILDPNTWILMEAQFVRS
jgi:aminopeptidase N